MRLLAAFIAICLLMAGLLVWGLWPERGHSDAAVPEWRRPAATRPAGGETNEYAAETPQTSASEAAAAQTSAVESRSAGAAADAGALAPAAETRPAVDDPGGAAPAPLHWAGTFDRRETERRLELAVATLRDDPTHPEALRDAVTLLAQLQRWSSAARYLDRLVAAQPDDAELRFEYGALLMRMRRFTDALDNLARAVALDPDHAAAWFNLAMARQQLGQLSAARRAWDTVIELEPSSAARAQRGEVLLDLGEWAAAAADFEAVLDGAPAAGHREPGDDAATTDRVDATQIERAPTAADADPTPVDVTLNLVTALEHLGETDAAAQRLRACLAAHPRSVPVLNRLAALAWQARQTATGEARRAWQDTVAECCRRSLEIDSNQPDVRGLLEQARPR